jgi:hypothetical protein
MRIDGRAINQLTATEWAVSKGCTVGHVMFDGSKFYSS